jgi:hypothetical protein
MASNPALCLPGRPWSPWDWRTCPVVADVSVASGSDPRSYPQVVSIGSVGTPLCGVSLNSRHESDG